MHQTARKTKADNAPLVMRRRYADRIQEVVVKKLFGTALVFALAIASSGGPLLAAAQNLPPTPLAVVEPETIGEVFFLRERTLVALELQRVTVKTKIKLAGFAGGVATGELKGDRAPLRVKSGDNLEFALQLPNGVDPSKFTLYSFDSQKDKRVVVLSKAGAFGGNPQQRMGELPFRVTRYGQNSYKLTPSQALPPGEYAWEAPGSFDVRVFGVDPQ